MWTIWWGRFLAEREKGERDSRRLGIRFAFQLIFTSGVVPFSRPSACELRCCCRRLVPAVRRSKWLASWIGLLVWFVDPNPAFFVVNFLYFLFVWWKVVEKSRNRRKDDRQPKICWFSLCLVNFLYFLFSLCFSRQPNKSCVILISCFTWFWKKFFDVVFSIDECVVFLLMHVWRSLMIGDSKSEERGRATRDIEIKREKKLI